MRRGKRIYLVEEDIRYYQEMFNQSEGGASAVHDPDFIAEFCRYADFIEKEFSYRIIIGNFPQVFLTRLVRV